MVKCQDCGFLAARDRETRKLVEVEKEMRQTGISPQLIGTTTHKYQSIPICFVRAFDLADGIKTQEDSRSFLHVIQIDRNCEKHTPWHQGFSPREHKEMIDAERLRDWQRKVEQEDRDYRDEQRRADLEREERQRQTDLDRQEKQRKDDREYRDKQDKWMRRQFWLTFIFGMILIPLVAALLQSISSWLASKVVK